MIQAMTNQEISEIFENAISRLNEAVGITRGQEPESESGPQAGNAVPEYPEASDLDSAGNEPYEEIPRNSDTALIDETTSRFSGAVWYSKIREKKILLAGLGGIGSYVAFLLSRMKPNRIVMYDPDIVEAANMAGQMFSEGNIGQSKVSAVTAMMHTYSNYYEVTSFRSLFQNETPSEDIMICGFDNMEARRIFFCAWRDRVEGLDSDSRRHCLFIDGRLAAEEFQVLCIRGDDSYNMDRYAREWLFTDSEAENEVCSYKQTSFMANMIGSVMVNLFVNFCANDIEGEEHPLIDRDLPFLTTYDASMMMFHTEA